MLKSRVTDSFAKHYLPNESSYIIFEYRRDQQTCMVVIYASHNEEGLCYRFVDKGFDPDDFLEMRSDGSCYPVSCRDLKRHFDKRRINCSRQLTSCSDYRTVIQNLSHSKGQELRNLVARYSFCQGSAGRRLKDMEKIVSGMLLRSTDFTDLREMLVNCIDENRESITLEMQMETLDNWHKEYRAYQETEAEREKAGELSQLATVLEQLKISFGELQKRLMLLRDCHHQNLQQQQASLNRTEQQLEKLKSDWEIQEQAIKSELTGLKAELEQAQRQKSQLEQEKTDWESQDIQQKLRLSEQLPIIEASLDRERQNRQQLTAQAQDIEAQFGRLRAEKEQDFAAQRHLYELQIQRIKTRSSENQAQARQENESLKETLRQTYQLQQDQLHKRSGELRQLLGALSSKIAEIQPDQPDPILIDSRESKLEQQ